MRKKKHILDLDQQEDAEFELIGICTHQPDYRLVWALNKELGTRFTQMQTKFIVSDKKGEFLSEHDAYAYEDEVNRSKVLLLSNRAEGKKFLIPEQQSVDFFLIFLGNGISDASDMANRIKRVPGVIAVFVFDSSELESAQALEFE